MNIQDQLFKGQAICLAPINPEKDAEIESKWTHDAEYLSLLSIDPIRPLSPAQVKKKYEQIEKDAEENKNVFYFALRKVDDDRLVGFANINWIEWNQGNGHIQLGIGDAADRGKGYGNEALRLLTRYAFGELNLHRLTAMIPEYNTVALHVFKKAGFTEEVRRRGAIYRAGRRWDAIHLGILRSEWEQV